MHDGLDPAGTLTEIQLFSAIGIETLDDEVGEETRPFISGRLADDDLT